MYIPIILGTAREGRESEKASNFVFQEAGKMDLKTKILDVRNYRLEATDKSGESPKALIFREEIAKADALIIVSPEYNHGYPGELKMMIDMLTKDVYSGKPIGICGVSNGGLGGARMVEQLKLVCIELGMVPIRESVYFSMVQDLFDARGIIKDKVYYDRVRIFLNQLISHIKK